MEANVYLVLCLILKATNSELSSVAFKCCGVFEHFDSSGRCVAAHWPPADVEIGRNETGIVSARDESWTSRWFPPGPPRSALVRKGLVFHSILSRFKGRTSNAAVGLRYVLYEYSTRATVNRSFFYQDEEGVRDSAKYMVVRGMDIVRIGPENIHRDAYYCVDAIEGSTAPYVVVFRTKPAKGNDKFSKCCMLGQVVVTKRAGNLDCKKDPTAWTNLANASFSSLFDSEIPFQIVSTYINQFLVAKLLDEHFYTTPLSPGDVRHANYIRHGSVKFLSTTWVSPCADLKRDENGAVREVLGYFAFTRRTRAAYLISRNLSFVSALILLAALVAILCKVRMRSSAHGWALGCHIVCLLFFNIGQIVYSLTMNAQIKKGMPMTPDERRACLGFAIPMYFLLTGASAWMTAVSANMFFGFKLTGGPRAGGGEWKRFLKLSAFAWGAAAALTGASVAAFLNVQEPMNEDGGGVQMLPWYLPTFAETRTCYSEVGYFSSVSILKYRSQKLGTSLYYYVPTLVMVAVNARFLWLTGRKVRYLRRGNSLLKRAEREGGGRKKGGTQQDKGSEAEPKSATVYIKLLLAGGLFEFLAELITWGASNYQPRTSQPSEDFFTRLRETWSERMSYGLEDHMYAHKTTGYWVDLFRALVVLLVLVVAPDLRAVWRSMRGKGGDSPAQSSATRSTPRGGQQESSL